MELINPGILEVYSGPMNSDKSGELIRRTSGLRYMQKERVKSVSSNPYSYICFKPDCDDRDGPYIVSGSLDIKLDATFIPTKKPRDLLKILQDIEEKEGKFHPFIIIDEIQFFPKGITYVLEHLQRQKRNIAVAGLGLNFRGEPFGQMGSIISMADRHKPLTAICQYDLCKEPATRTQRLNNGKPCNYSEPLLVIEKKDTAITYESRCLEHHFVPRRH